MSNAADERPALEFFTNEELTDELAKRHTALIVSGQRHDGCYYCQRHGQPLVLRGLINHAKEVVMHSVRNWESHGRVE